MEEERKMRSISHLEKENGQGQTDTFSLPFRQQFHITADNDAINRDLRDVQTMKFRLVAMREALGTMPAEQLTERDIDLYLKQRKAAGRMPATLKAENDLSETGYRLAVRKELLAKIPYTQGFKLDNARQGFFEKDAIERVIAALPDWLKDFTRFAYYSGWRMKEIATLEWRDIHDEVISLRPEVSKNAEGRKLVMVGELAEIIKVRQFLRKDLVPYVFHRDGERIKPFHQDWRKACKKAEVPGKLFHDLRRTAVRNLVQAGVPEKLAMDITGHKTRAIFDRYNISNEDDIRGGLERMQKYLEMHETRTIHTRERNLST